MPGVLASDNALRVRRATVLRAAPVFRGALDRAPSTRAQFQLLRAAIHSGSHQVPEEIGGFLEYARTTGPRRICEIGTAAGGTTVLLMRASPEVEVVIALDRAIQNVDLLEALRPRRVALEAIEGSSLLPATRDRLQEVLAGHALDLLFIDGSHAYDDVRADFESYRGFVRSGGLIAFHDIIDDYRTRYGRDTGHHSDGVPEFWRLLRGRFPSREFVRDPGQDGYGIGVIEHDPSVSI